MYVFVALPGYDVFGVKRLPAVSRSILATGSEAKLIEFTINIDLVLEPIPGLLRRLVGYLAHGGKQ